MMEFIMDNYIWIMIILAIALLACVGYLVDKKEKKQKKKVDNKNEAITPEVTVSKEEAEVQPIEPQFELPQEESVETVDAKEETMETEIPQEESVEATDSQEEVENQLSEEITEEPVMEEISVEELQTPILEQEEIKETAIEENNDISELETFEPIDSVSEEPVESVEESTEEIEELTPVEQPRSELIDSSDELLLEGDSSIDHDFQSLLEDEDMEELEVDLPPIEETKKEDFKSIDDDDEDLWTF